MKKAIIIHGSPSKEEFFDQKTPSPSNFQFLPWLQKELLLRDVIAQTPEMPAPYNPVYEESIKKSLMGSDNFKCKERV